MNLLINGTDHARNLVTGNRIDYPGMNLCLWKKVILPGVDIVCKGITCKGDGAPHNLQCRHLTTEGDVTVHEIKVEKADIGGKLKHRGRAFGHIVAENFVSLWKTDDEGVIDEGDTEYHDDQDFLERFMRGTHS